MTDNEIIKALECCKQNIRCAECPLLNKGQNCMNKLYEYALDLINRQKTEIEMLREIRDLCNATILEQKEQIEELKISDASKEECTIKQHGEIKELKAKVEKLRNLVRLNVHDFTNTREKDIKAEAIKEYIDAVKPTRFWHSCEHCGKDVDITEAFNDALDGAYEEMVGDNE